MKTSQVTAPVLFALLTLGAQESAAADFELRAVAQTDAPLFVGAGLQAEGPLRLRLSTSVGLLPGGYLAAVNGVLVPLLADSGYGEPQAELVEVALNNALVSRTTLGWRPFEDQGFHFGLGYTFIGLGGGASAGELIEGVTGAELPESQRNEGYMFDARAAMHQVHAEVGWEWRPIANLYARAGLGFGLTVGAFSDIEAQDPPTRPAAAAALDAFEAAGDAYLEDLFVSYVHIPYVSLSLGWAWEL